MVQNVETQLKLHNFRRERERQKLKHHINAIQLITSIHVSSGMGNKINTLKYHANVLSMVKILVFVVAFWEQQSILLPFLNLNRCMKKVNVTPQIGITLKHKSNTSLKMVIKTFQNRQFRNHLKLITGHMFKQNRKNLKV